MIIYKTSIPNRQKCVNKDHPYVSGAIDIYDDEKQKSQEQVNKDVDAAILAEKNRAEAVEALHQSEINALNSQNYVTVDSFSSLPATGAVDTVYRVSNWDGIQQDPSVYSEYAWNGEDYEHLSTKTQIGEVFDISAYHATGGEIAKYADLAAALGTNGANIPQSIRKGGMSIKYVQSSDNKYVQYRLMATAFTTDETQWQGVDIEPTNGSHSVVESGGVALAEMKIKALIESLLLLVNPDSVEDEFIVTDKNGNIVIKYSEDGFDVAKVAGHLRSLLAGSNKETSNGVIKISSPGNEFRYGFLFKANVNLNVGNTDIPLVQVETGTGTVDAKMMARATSLDFGKRRASTTKNGTYVNLDPTYRQIPSFNSGYIILGQQFLRQPLFKRPLVGDTAFWMWLKGDFSDFAEEKTEGALISRSNSLRDDYQDYCIVIDSDTFSITRDGIGAQNQEFNGGATSTVFTTSLKSGGSYKSLSTLYAELKADSTLASLFDFKIGSLSATKTCEDLLQFGKVKLVGRYYQHLNYKSTDYQYRYDSFPVSIYLANDESLHSCEVVYDGSRLYIQIDGECYQQSVSSISSLSLGGTLAMVNSGIEIVKTELEQSIENVKIALGGDSNYHIMSDLAYCMLGIESHSVEDKYEGETLDNELNMSVSRANDVADALINNGYQTLGARNLIEVLTGQVNISKNSAYILRADAPGLIPSAYSNDARKTWARYGLNYIVGTIIEKSISGYTDSAFKDMITAAFRNNIESISHSLWQDGEHDLSCSLLNYWQFNKNKGYLEELGMNADIYSWAPSCIDEQVYTQLNICGFIAAIGNTGSYTVQATNPYQLCRTDCADRTAWADFIKYIFN